MDYTKGIWQVRANVDGNGNKNDYPLCVTVSKVYGYYLVAGVYMAGDAKLIAAAPDMYEALKSIVKGIDTGTERIGQGRYNKCVAAIAKAEGNL